MLTKEQLGKVSEKIIEILGLEEYQGNKDMLLIRNESGEVLKGINFTDEVIDLTQFIDDYYDEIQAS